MPNVSILGKKLLIGVLLILTVIAVIIVSRQKRQEVSVPYIQEQEIVSFLKDGDIICRLGNRPWSVLFKNLSPNEKRFSHLGIVRIRDDVITVINAEGLSIEGRDVVNEVTLKEFLKTALSAGIYRMRNIEGEKISDTALEYLGRPFDWQFDMIEDENIYCTELLYIVLKRLDPEIKLNTTWVKEIGKDIIPLDVCSQLEYFVEVGYWGGE
ncbi:MAG: hypothetical protein FWD26_10785 [Treponema sp.]|nr:hypothetical protein [Treponema sp.]